MIRIDENKCIGCGACAKDCPMEFIHLEGGKARMNEPWCIDCGHCFALCPADAIRIEGYSEEEHLACEEVPKTCPVDPDDLLTVMKSRRSIRQFTDREPEPEKLQKLIEAVRYAPTGRNTQCVRVKTIAGEALSELTDLITQVLEQYTEELPQNASEELKMIVPYYKIRWKEMRQNYVQTGKDALFRGAKTVLVLSGPNDVDPAIAASYAELLAYTLDLGCIYIGFVKLAAEDARVQKALKLKKRDHVVCTLALGYPAVKYRRTVPRNQKKI